MALVRAPEAGDEKRWRALWQGYVTFYRQTVPEEVTAATWARMCDPGSGVMGRVVEVDGQVDGFATCILHPCTWTLRPICYLEDLFVAPERRGAGLGRALIDDILALAVSQGWSRVYWHTQAGNATARALYDRYTKADDFVRYRLFVGS